jgi:glutamate-5-semialdehyde dehydrogenase
VNDIHDMSVRARNAFYRISASTAESRNSVLLTLARLLENHKTAIFEANGADLAASEEEALPAPLLHRLTFGEEKLSQTIRGLEALAQLPDPIDRTLDSTEITEGLSLYRVSAPIGVVGVIFESRPDALIQISSLCIKSGNAVLLKGGREALRTNQVLCELVREALSAVSLPADTAQLLETREDVSRMLKEDTLIDLIIPRGSNQFVRYIMDNSRIPVLGHSDGICHVYIDDGADIDTACKITVDSKTQNVSVCNALETLLVHRNIAPAFLAAVFPLLAERNVRILGDAEVQRLIPCDPASEEDWSSEYLDYILSIRIVPSLEEAISHINQYGSHHTDCIVSASADHASEFMKQVDSAGVYWNVSTRFADGFVYGLGAEVGIATGKLHARGPMGLDGLTTYKYKLIGNGQTMAEMKSGVRTYTHRKNIGPCPL